MMRTSPSPKSTKPYNILRLSLIALPFLSYFTFPAFLYVLGVKFRQVIHQRCWPVDGQIMLGLGLTSGCLILSTVLASHPGEAALQLFNFLPFFAFLVLLPSLLNSLTRLEELAVQMAIASMPISAIAFCEFLAKTVAKSSWIPRELRRTPLGRWLRSLPHQNRAMVDFDHPNVLASYLVVILGLSLGVILSRMLQRQAQQDNQQVNPSKPAQSRMGIGWIIAAACFSVVGIFSSGSRNGLLIAVIQAIAFIGLLQQRRIQKQRRAILFAAAGLGLVLAGVASFGLAGRSLTWEEFSNDPRVEVWRIALTLFQQRPWFGWGLGNYKFLYPDLGTNPDYPNIFHTHNFWLLLSAEAGIFAMLALTCTVAYVVIRTVYALMQQPRSSSTAIAWGYLLAFAGCSTFALFDVTLYDSRINLLNWVVLAALYCLPQIFSDKDQDPSLIPSVKT